MEQKTFQVWVTKYALTEGVHKYTARSTSEPSMVVVGSWYLHGEGRDWHRTRESAIARAYEMKRARLASLAKSVKRVEKIEFI